MTYKYIVVAKPAVSTLTSLDSSFQVMIKASTETGDVLKSHCLSLWPWEEEGRAKRWNFENRTNATSHSTVIITMWPLLSSRNLRSIFLCARKVRKLVISEC